MKLVVRVQYVGDRARILLREDQAPQYTKGLIDDLTAYGFPVPHEQKPIEKSGFMLCHYYVERDSDAHRIIQTAFARAKAEAATLMDRSIRYISLNEDGVMHSTNLSQKPYKPKAYNKPDYQPPYQSSGYKQQYGKAPKYPSTISQARHGASPLAQRMAVDAPGPSAYDMDYRDSDIHRPHRSPPPISSEGASSMVDVTQQTLMQLSQSSAIQSLLQKATPGSAAPPAAVKTEPASSADLTTLLRQPISNMPPQPSIPNLQALLEKAGVKSASAQAVLQNRPPSHDQYHPANSKAAMAPSPSLASTSHLSSLPPPSLLAPSHTSSPSTAAPQIGGSSTSTAPRVPTLRELWDIRREITALQARGRNTAAELRAAGQQIPLGPEDATPPSMTGGNAGGGADLLKMRELEAEILSLRKQLTQETNARKLAEATLRAERALRTEMEDVKRECRQPFVVPALFDAFMQIGQMTGDVLADAPSSSGTQDNSMSMEY
ncbi:hypothetical protein BN946_scf185008.g119 [Trametes cinnabarina]|uniref:Uncharacterized protein n=1 Tax=Pycnoporus cinnabarinus TaxID=5643 RepID=A0A060SGR1_PYCCI|nr:hypothetical protein BN946_scf185008.g119 [Trametes cinnabarina]